MNKFEEKLWEETKKNWKYEKIPMFKGQINPKTGKQEYLHVLIPEKSNLIEYYTCLEIVDE